MELDWREHHVFNVVEIGSHPLSANTAIIDTSPPSLLVFLLYVWEEDGFEYFS